jgi:hypothetical protein
MIPDRSTAVHEHEREIRNFYRSLGMTDEFATRALAAAKKSLPGPRHLKHVASPSVCPDRWPGR